MVIDGAKALALPTKFGQDLRVKTTDSSTIHWISRIVDNNIWLDITFDLNTLDILESNDHLKAEKLQKTLIAAKELNASFPKSGLMIETNLQFPNNWGLGSSSTLLCNIAKWLKTDAFELHFKVSNGSGYDIAVGMKNEAITYTVNQQKPSVQPIAYYPTFKDKIFFIHLNQKQTSDQEVSHYNELKKELNLDEIARTFESLTDRIISAESLESFEVLIREHEQLMSHILQRETIRESLFQMYTGGVIKSLGAWGGDFVMVTAKKSSDLEYFKDKGFNTILSFDEMIAR
ncbi:MAG: GHMP kinase [Flavobacteriales bacterium]|nr:GHMP kinase [Flavobacteriales bacterium]